MASIRKRGDRWQARVQRRGHPTEARSFTNRSDATKWARAAERRIDVGEIIPARAWRTQCGGDSVGSATKGN